jgi:transcriptional regulator with XRE-family HTH domain
MNEKIEFSNRLRDAMTKSGYLASPSVLEHEFNLRWYGRSISNQAAWGWLNNRSIPTQEKLQVLAEWLKVEPQVLRFGEAVRNSVQQQKQRWDEGIGYAEREMFDTFLKLPAPLRKLVRDVIMNLAKVPAEPESASEKPLT